MAVEQSPRLEITWCRPGNGGYVNQRLQSLEN